MAPEWTHTHANFRTTDWSVVRKLDGADESQRSEFLGCLVESYWAPTYAWLRRSGRSPDRAAELTQGFFVSKVLVNRIFDRADRDRGRLRNLLLTALQHYERDVIKHEQVHGGELKIPLHLLDREERFVKGESDRSPHETFDRRWAMRILEEAVRRCETYFGRAGRAGHWEAFRRTELLPKQSGNRGPPLASIANELGFSSAMSVASATKVVRSRLRILLREVAAETALEPAGRITEYDHVISVLGGN